MIDKVSSYKDRIIKTTINPNMPEKINFKNLKKPYVIAEMRKSSKLNNSILGIKNAGANCVKFQMYKADQLVLENMSLMPHVKKISNEKHNLRDLKVWKLQKMMF